MYFTLHCTRIAVAAVRETYREHDEITFSVWNLRPRLLVNKTPFVTKLVLFLTKKIFIYFIRTCFCCCYFSECWIVHIYIFCCCRVKLYRWYVSLVALFTIFNSCIAWPRTVQRLGIDFCAVFSPFLDFNLKWKLFGLDLNCKVIYMKYVSRILSSQLWKTVARKCEKKWYKWEQILRNDLVNKRQLVTYSGLWKSPTTPLGIDVFVLRNEAKSNNEERKWLTNDLLFVECFAYSTFCVFVCVFERK